MLWETIAIIGVASILIGLFLLIVRRSGLRRDNAERAHLPPATITRAERTPKRLKAQMLIGVGVALIGGIVMLCAPTGRAADHSLTNVYGAIILGMGLLIFLFARLHAWWDHG